MQTSPGHFAAPITVPAGIAPSDIAVADINGDGRPDIVVTDQASGEVTVLLNDPQHASAGRSCFPAGAGLVRPGWGLGQPDGELPLRSR